MTHAVRVEIQSGKWNQKFPLARAMRSVILTAVLLTSLASCKDRLPASMEAQFREVDVDLKWLLSLLPSEDNWVVFSDKQTELFVQFEVIDGRLVADVPLTGRTAEQVDRLGRLFSQVGGSRPVVVSATDPKTRKPFDLRSFRADFGTETTKAANFTIRVFSHAYMLSELELEVERNEAVRDADANL